MSTKEMIYNMIDSFSEEQLQGLLTMLKGYSKIILEAEDDAYCTALYKEYKEDNETDKEDTVSIEDFAEELGIELK